MDIDKLSRGEFIRIVSSTTASLYFYSTNIYDSKKRTTNESIINKIGNSNDQREQVLLIGKAINNPIFTSEERVVLEKLLFVADRWVNGFEKYANPGIEGNEGSGFLCGFFSRFDIENSIFPEMSEKNRIFPLVAFYWSRILIALLIQNGHISLVPENKKKYLNESKRLLHIAKDNFPNNHMIKMYLGDFSPWEDVVKLNTHAPDWANSQRMLLEKLTFLINWWIENRQISDGQFGGGWGDDVEIWRNWLPILFAFDDKRLINSQVKLFEGLFALPMMKKGYTNHLNDVEHTSEEYADPLTCMLLLDGDNPIWEKRALRVLEYIENLWCGINDRNELQFKSTWFSVDEIDLESKRACDSPYHTRLVQPLMLIWQRNGNKRVEKFIMSWLRTWCEATFVEECGKPNGIIPAAIHWPDGKPCGVGVNWWKPENYHSPLYDYPSQQDMMYEMFLQAYVITKDEYYLKPIDFVMDKYKLGFGSMAANKYKEGSLDWALSKIKFMVAKVVSKYNMVVGDSRYISFPSILSNGYEKYLIEKNVDDLTIQFDQQRKSLSLPIEFYTTEVRWTDRLFLFNVYFRNIMKESLPSYNSGLLFSCLSGNVGNYKVMPVYGVCWKTHSKDIAIIVNINTSTIFQAKLFHFGSLNRKMGGEFFNLISGRYKISMTNKDTVFVDLNKFNNTIDFTLPPMKEIIIDIRMIR